MPAGIGYDPKFNALKQAQEQTLKLLQRGGSASTKRNLIKNLLQLNSRMGIGGNKFAPKAPTVGIKESLTSITNPLDDLSTEPLVRHLRQSRRGVEEFGKKVSNFKSGSRARIDAARPTGKTPGLKIPGLGGTPSGIKSFQLGGETSIPGLGLVGAAGAIGAAAIKAASEKTRRLQNKLDKETNQIADDLLTLLRKRNRQ